MENNQSLKQISDNLISWYHENKRDLPWRDIFDPYKIWISEIILQQTRVNQGLNYYIRFIERFPTAQLLAEATEDDVLKYWQGLGYYSRARNLHKAAQQIMFDFGGYFPTNHKDVLLLSGIGDYTAAAICSLAYNQPYAVVDGNVYRVLSRLFGIKTPIDSGKGKREFAELAQNLLSKSEPANHNQAMMEFGALQCVPMSPNCEKCPLEYCCKAFEINEISNLPVKSNKTKTTNRYFNYLFINWEDKTFLQKRSAKDIWQNLYEFPLIESDKLLETNELIAGEEFKSLFNGIPEVTVIKTSNPMKHILSHRVIYAKFTTISITGINNTLENLTATSITEIDDYAVSRLMELFLEKK
jgi:A/G-specific adenine glycosylase